MQYFNVHTHIFTSGNSPKDFLKLFIHPLLADLVENVTNTEVGAWLVRFLSKWSKGNAIKRYATFLKIGKSKDQFEIFENLFAQYKDDSNIKFVGLTLNMEHLGAGTSLSGFEGQLEQSMNVKRRYPDKLLLFLGLDPRWKATGAELRDTVAAYFDTRLKTEQGEVYPFCGLKIYPSTGYYVFDPRLKETLEWAADNGVPVLSHCNYLGGLYNNDAAYLNSYIGITDPYTGQSYPGKYIKDKKVKLANKYTCSYLLEPASYESVLQYFKDRGTPLKLCLAHFGGDDQIRTLIANGKKDPVQQHPFGTQGINWFTQIQNMMARYESLYTDISYAVFDKNLHQTFIGQAQQPYGNRIMYGTDFFMTEQEKGERDIYMDFKQISSITTGNSGKSVWEEIAGDNTGKFLSSKYYTTT